MSLLIQIVYKSVPVLSKLWWRFWWNYAQADVLAEYSGLYLIKIKNKNPSFARKKKSNVFCTSNLKKTNPQKSINEKSTNNTVFHGGSEPYSFVVYGEGHLVKKVFSVFLIHQSKYSSNCVVVSEAPKTVVTRLIWKLLPFEKVYGLVGQGLLKIPLEVAVVQKFARDKESDKGKTCRINQSHFLITCYSLPSIHQLMYHLIFSKLYSLADWSSPLQHYWVRYSGKRYHVQQAG